MADETIDIRYRLNPDEFEAESKRVDKAIESTQASSIDATGVTKENIEIQKRVLKELEGQYRSLQKTAQRVAPGAARSAMESELGAAKREIDQEKTALDQLNTAYRQHQEQNRSLRSQMVELRSQMANMTEGTDEYRSAMEKLGNLQDRYADIQRQGSIMSDDYKYFNMAKEGIQGLSGAMSVGMGVATLFGASQENLQKIQAKLQAVMAISVGTQQIAQLLNKDSYFTHLLLTKAKAADTAITTTLSGAVTRLGVSSKVATVAARGLTVAITGGLVLGMWALMNVMEKHNQKREEERKRIEQARKTNDDYATAVANNAASQLLSYKSLQSGWQKLGDNISARSKFISDNRSEFSKLGLAINDVNDAERLLVSQSDSVINALMARAKASAAQELAVNKYKEALQLEEKTKDFDMGQMGKEDYEKEIGRKLHSSEITPRMSEQLEERGRNIIKAQVKGMMDEGDKFFERSNLFNQQANSVLGSGVVNSQAQTAKQSESILLKLERERLAIMEDGRAKELAQIEFSRREKLAALDKEQREMEELLRGQGKSISGQEVAAFDERRAVANQGADNQTEKVNTKYDKELTDSWRTLSQVFMSEEQKKTQAIEERYAKERELIVKLYSNLPNGGLTSLTLIGASYANEAQEKLKEFEEKYKTSAQRITEIEQQAQADRLKAQTPQQTAQVDKWEKTEKSKIKADELVDSEDWRELMQNLDVMTTSQINALVEKINTQLQGAKLDPVNFKALTDQLSQAREQAVKNNPYKVLALSVENYRSAVQRLAQAQTEQEKKEAQADVKRAKKQTAQSALQSISETTQALSAMSDLMQTLGMESDPIVDGVLGSLSAIGSIDVSRPFSIITGGLQAISSLVGGIFGSKDKRKQQEIERLQIRIDALKDSYEELGRAIDKAYSKNASNLINQSNELLAKQRALLVAQIREEEGKKNSDDGAIDNWRKEIENIDKLIEQNKEKSKDAIFGSDLKGAIDDFASAYTSAWSGGEDRAKAQKDVVKKMLQGIISEMIKSDIAGEVERMREKIVAFMGDDVLSDDELAQIDKMGSDIGAIMEKRGEMYDKILKADAQNGESLAGQIRGSVATEASVAELGGIFRGIYDKSSAIDAKCDMGFKEVANMARTLILIEQHTKETAGNTAQTVEKLEEGFSEMKTELMQIRKNTSKDNGSY